MIILYIPGQFHNFVGGHFNRGDTAQFSKFPGCTGLPFTFYQKYTITVFYKINFR